MNKCIVNTPVACRPKQIIHTATGHQLTKVLHVVIDVEERRSSDQLAKAERVVEIQRAKVHGQLGLLFGDLGRASVSASR